MSIYYNPESTSSENQNHYQLSNSRFLSVNPVKQNSIHNQKSSTNHQTPTRSVGKFKRTNPSLQNTNPTSPFPKKPPTDLSSHSRINYVKCEQLPINQNKNSQIDIATNLTSSRQTPRTEEAKTILYLSPSKEHKIMINQRNSLTREKFNPQQEDLKSFRSGKSSNKGSKHQNENYSIYWKKKAHEYLQNNFKLSEEISDLKKQLQKYQVTLPIEASVTTSQLGFSSSESQSQVEKTVPVYIVQMQQKNYLQQISHLEISNRLKDSVIENMQNKIIELTQQIQGEKEKSELLQKMRRQIGELEQKNKKLAREQEKTIKLNKIYETQRSLQEVKQKSNAHQSIVLAQFADYKFEKDLQKHRYRSLE